MNDANKDLSLKSGCAQLEIFKSPRVLCVCLAFFFFTCSQTEKKNQKQNKKKKIKSVKVSGAVQHLSNPEHNKKKTSYKKRFTRIIDVHAIFLYFQPLKMELKKKIVTVSKKQKVTSTYFKNVRVHFFVL